MVYGSLIGLYIFWALGLFIRRRDFKNEFLMYQNVPDTGFLALFSISSLKYYFIAGIILGAYSGYNISIGYSAYQTLQLQYSLAFMINSLVSIVTALLVLLVENIPYAQKLLLILYTDDTTWSITKFSKSLYISIVIAEYIGLFGCIYATATEIGVYIFYVLFLKFGWKFLVIAFLVCCTANLWVVVDKFLMLRKRRFQKLKETEMSEITEV